MRKKKIQEIIKKKNIHLSSYSNYFSEMARFLEVTLLKNPLIQTLAAGLPLTPTAWRQLWPRGAAVCTDRW